MPAVEASGAARPRAEATPEPPMRILVVGTNYPPHVLGGYELACAGVVAWLRGRGHDVTVLTTTYGTAHGAVREESGPNGERIVRGLVFQWKDFEIRRLRGRALLAAEWRQATLTRRVLRETRPDVAMIWHMAAVSKSVLAVVERARVPMLVVLQEPWPAWDLDQDAWTGRWSRPAYRSPARVLKPLLRPLGELVAPTTLGSGWDAAVPAYSSEWLRGVVDAAVPAWKGRGEVVGNGVELERARRYRDDDEPVGRPLRLLYAGRVEPRKGVATAVEALAIVRRAGVEAALDLVGWTDAAYGDRLRALAAAEDVAAAVRFSDAVSREDLPDVFRAHDVCVFPTVWPEPFGLVPLEAMAAGCVVTATGTGGSGEFLRDGENALIHPVDDAQALAAALLRLAREPALVARLRSGGRATAAGYDMPIYARRLEAMAQRLRPVA